MPVVLGRVGRSHDADDLGRQRGGVTEALDHRDFVIDGEAKHPGGGNPDDGFDLQAAGGDLHILTRHLPLHEADVALEVR